MLLCEVLRKRTKARNDSRCVELLARSVITHVNRACIVTGCGDCIEGRRFRWAVQCLQQIRFLDPGFESRLRHLLRFCVGLSTWTPRVTPMTHVVVCRNYEKD
jgi:hypothetical protein